MKDKRINWFVLLAGFAILFTSSCKQNEDLVDVSRGWKVDLTPLQIDFPQAEPYTQTESNTEGSAVDEQSHRDTVRTMTFTKTFPPGQITGSPSFFIRRVSDRAELFLNGRHIGSNAVGSSSHPFYTPLFARTHDDLWYKNRANVLRLRLFTDRDYPLDVDGSVWMANDPGVLQRFLLETEIFQFSLLSIYAVAGLYFLILFFYNRDDDSYLYFGIFSLLLAAHWYFNTMHRDFLFYFDLLLRSRIQHITLYLAVPSFNLFLSALFFKGKRTALALVSIGSLASAFALVLPDYRSLSILLTGYYAVIGVSAIHATIVSLQAWKQKQNMSRPVVIGALIFTVSALHDVMLDLDWIDSIRISDYSFAIPVVGMAAMLAAGFARNRRELKQMNEELEDRVASRTSELSDSLQTIRELKELQDGDYYLTSLLIRPLSDGNLIHKHGSVATHIQQRRKVRFRKWDVEIGGDIAAAREISLRNKPFIAFMNADAMGKSIQGAGGALILGTVFKSRISRTLSHKSTMGFYPERWLKEFYRELQTLFLEFDGSMSATAAIGLMDLEQGMLYYMNMEHPSPVLYRNGQAIFLFPGHSLYRLGMEMPGHPLRVHCAKLQNEDIVVFGSDGRDDLQISMDERGERIINENENLFLQSVRDGEGDPHRIAQEIQMTGKLTDDLVLTAVRYHNYSKTRFNNSNMRDHKLPSLGTEKAFFDLPRARRAIQEGELAIARKIYAEYIEYFPWDTGAIFTLAQIYSKLGEWDLALDEAERCRLRKPDSMQIQAFRRRLGQRVFEQQPGHPAEKLEQMDPSEQMAA